MHDSESRVVCVCFATKMATAASSVKVAPVFGTVASALCAAAPKARVFCAEGKASVKVASEVGADTGVVTETGAETGGTGIGGTGTASDIAELW